MTRRYFIQLAYKGTNYHGWQIQNNAKTVQGTLNKAFSTVLREKIEVIGAGRTDTGVHASFFVAHFDTQQQLDTKALTKKMNSFLPADIAIHKIFEVKHGLHSRFDAISRTYKYFIHLKPNPFINDLSFYLYWKPDVDKMQQAADTLFEYKDFKAFSKAHSGVKTYICEIYKAQWNVDNDKLVFTIKANRFLRNMVRAIVGTLLEVGKGKLNVDDFRRIIEIRDRRAASVSAAPQGLYLTNIEYPDSIESHLDKNYNIFWNEPI